MVQRDSIQIGNFTLDIEGQCMLHLGCQVPVRPKSWFVLRHLAEHPGVLLSILALCCQGAVLFEQRAAACLARLQENMPIGKRRPSALLLGP